MPKKPTRYEIYVEKVYSSFEQAADRTASSLFEAMEDAKAYFKAAGQLGKDEIDTMEQFFMRDYQAFIEQLNKQADQSIWVHSLKDKFSELLADMTDHSAVQAFEFKQDLDHHGEYSVGEIVALGELVCLACGHRHPVDFPETIQPCTQCGHSHFSRFSD
ncbi:zinc ribbon-containing protein [Aestuariibacter sp. AA17]|uniref:Zinc ribbon-containing protein n=1 Tax=Fluctibacter corallii TaxID=2984329 RepID=A0ABT3A5M1_9ALTE|nr:zinc ribbon-containing protein [Aestuariibacter sp. AA17]MCV2883979.1 zinc ribbon-containing protein [Aestuariibacter sp. AA17]